MKQFRTVVFWCHLAAGLFAGVVVVIMSVTGVLLTYQRQITAWADVRGLEAGPPAAGAQRLPVAALLERVHTGEGPAPTAVLWRAEADAPVQVSFGRERRVFVNGYTGEVLGEGSAATRDFFRWVTDWHRWLGRGEESRAWGKGITGACNLAFLFLVVSGFYLWWPRNWSPRALRNVTLFRGGLSGKARDFNWHNVIGFWSFVPLFLVVLSGVVISYRWAGDLVYRVAGEAPPPPAAGRGGGGGRPAEGGPRPGGGERGGATGRGEGRAAGGEGAAVTAEGFEPLMARAERHVPGWRIITLELPRGGADSVKFTIDRGDGGQPQSRGTLVLHRASAEVLKWEPFSAATPGRQARMILRFAHTGEVLGLIGQTIAGLVSLGAVVLVWTGFALTWRRFRAWRVRPERQPSRRPLREKETAGV